MQSDVNESSRVAMREKLWPERDSHEKMEALRVQVVSLLARSKAQSALIDKLLEHIHGPSGDICVPIHDSRSTNRDLYIPVPLRDRE